MQVQRLRCRICHVYLMSHVCRPMSASCSRWSPEHNALLRAMFAAALADLLKGYHMCVSRSRPPSLSTAPSLSMPSVGLGGVGGRGPSLSVWDFDNAQFLALKTRNAPCAPRPCLAWTSHLQKGAHLHCLVRTRVRHTCHWQRRHCQCRASAWAAWGRAGHLERLGC
jgi:hypothetical protein